MRWWWKIRRYIIELLCMVSKCESIFQASKKLYKINCFGVKLMLPLSLSWTPYSPGSLYASWLLVITFYCKVIYRMLCFLSSVVGNQKIFISCMIGMYTWILSNMWFWCTYRTHASIIMTVLLMFYFFYTLAYMIPWNGVCVGF